MVLQNAHFKHSCQCVSELGAMKTQMVWSTKLRFLWHSIMWEIHPGILQTFLQSCEAKFRFNVLVFWRLLVAWLCFHLTAGSDYLAAHEPIVFRVNGEGRACVNITIINDKIIDEPYEVFLIHLTSTDASVFASRTAVVILDQDGKFCTIVVSCKYAPTCT